MQNPPVTTMATKKRDLNAPKKALKKVKALKYEPMSKEERCLRLQRIYDDAIEWIEVAVQEREPKGTGAATMLLERSRLEIVELERTRDGGQKHDITIVFKQAEKDEKTEDPA